MSLTTSRSLLLFAVAAAVLGCAAAPPTKPWEGAQLSREGCREADSIYAAGPDTTYMYGWAIGNLPGCGSGGWKKLAKLWGESRHSTDSTFLILLWQAGRGWTRPPTLDSMLSIARGPDASNETRGAAFRGLTYWRIPSYFVYDTIVPRFPRGWGCQWYWSSDSYQEPPPPAVAARIDQLLVDLSADTSHTQLQRRATCYLEFLAAGDSADLTEPLKRWEASRGQ